MDAADRNYRDDNHKPELLVALSETFEALCGLRPLDATRRLAAALGDGVGPAALRARLDRTEDDADILREVIGWLLSGAADVEVASLIEAIGSAESIEFAAELSSARRIASVYPGDPGVIVALLMNHVVLHRGEGVFLRAGLLHAYLSGLGVEVMAASDNVLRGGLTPKHVDVDELLAVLDARPAVVPVVLPTSADGASRGVEAFATDAPDFELLRARVPSGAEATVALRGAAIALVTAGKDHRDRNGRRAHGAAGPGRVPHGGRVAGAIRGRWRGLRRPARHRPLTPSRRLRRPQAPPPRIRRGARHAVGAS